MKNNVTRMAARQSPADPLLGSCISTISGFVASTGTYSGHMRRWVPSQSADPRLSPSMEYMNNATGKSMKPGYVFRLTTATGPANKLPIYYIYNL